MTKQAYILGPTAKPEHWRFTIRNGVLTSTSSRQRSAISSRPLPERTDFGPHSLLLDRPTCVPASRTVAFTPQCSPATTHYFSRKYLYYQVLTATYLPTPEEQKAELA